MCLFAYSSRTDEPICAKLGTLIPWDQEENIGGPELREVSWVRFPVRAFPVARKLNTIEEWRLDQSCLFRRGDYRNKNQNPGKLSWVRFPAKTVSVARISRTTEERRQDQSYLSWVRILTRKFYATPKLSRREKRRRGKFVRFGEEIKGTEATNPKTVLGSSLGEDYGFRDNFFYNIRRYVTLGMAYDITHTNPRREPRR
jgi:hypothetical protein